MAVSSPRNDLVKNYRVHPTHCLISTQVPPPGVRDVARWVTWTTLVSAAHPDHLYPFQNGEFSLFDVLGEDDDAYDAFIDRVAAARRSEKKKLKREQELKAADPDNLPPHLRGVPSGTYRVA